MMTQEEIEEAETKLESLKAEARAIEESLRPRCCAVVPGKLRLKAGWSGDYGRYDAGFLYLEASCGSSRFALDETTVSCLADACRHWLRWRSGGEAEALPT